MPSGTMITSNITTNTDWNAAGAPYTIAANVAVANGVTLSVDAGVSVQLQPGVTLTDNGTLTFASGDTVTLASSFSTQQIVVGNGGVLNANGSTFSASGGTSLITVNGGGQLTANNSTFASSLSQVSLNSGSILSAGNFTGNSFNCPLLLPESDVQYLSGTGSNNAQFQDIDILAGTSLRPPSQWPRGRH